MARWTFEPGHTAAEFRVRHMMVTWVRGAFKDVHGTLDFDPDNPAASSVEVTIDAAKIWSGEEARDAHLKNADFLDVENHPTITFKGGEVEVFSAHDYAVTGELTIRGVTRPARLDVRYLGQWDTPWWEDGVDKGPLRRAGFVRALPAAVHPEPDQPPGLRRQLERHPGPGRGGRRRHGAHRDRRRGASGLAARGLGESEIRIAKAVADRPSGRDLNTPRNVRMLEVEPRDGNWGRHSIDAILQRFQRRRP